MKRRICCGLILAVLAGVSSCGSPPPRTKPLIGLTLPASWYPFFIALKKNVADEADKLDVELISSDAEDSPARQMAIVEDFIARRVDAVLIAPISADALVPAIEALNQAGIPVATVDRKVSSGEVLIHVGADNVEGGRVAARYLIEKLGGRGGVIELEGAPGASSAIDRKRGFDETLAGSQMKLLASQSAEFLRAKGHSVMENLLQVHNDFQAVYAANDDMMLGALEAMEAKHVDLSQVVTIGFDALPEAVARIRDGKLTATVEQFPGQQGRRALGALVAYLRDGKRPAEKEVYLTPVAIDRHNLDTAEAKQ